MSDYPSLLRQLLFNRSLMEKEKIDKFLEPKYEGLHSPYLFKDMAKAVDRIFEAIEKNEQICIYGDYDADAITANAVLRQAFKFLAVNVKSYIPDRFSEGYGVNLEALAKIKNDGSTVIITVDCGTNSIDAAEWCKKNNIDFIITDHHEIIGEAPEALAIINPKNPADTYPDNQITGVGVAFKMASAILNSDKRLAARGEYRQGQEKWLLDLVAIGTVADCHALTGENRIFVKFGLKVLVKTKWTGLKALCIQSGLDFSEKLPDTYTLGFVIAPRLNAAGRLEHANVALDLLMEENFDRALEQALNLEKVNKRRQDLTAQVLSEARGQAQIINHRKILMLSAADWPKGVVGLVAGKLAEEFYRPTIVLSKDAETATGSARTVGNFSIIEALKFSSHHLVRFGGHQQAAGLTIKNESFEGFYQSLLEYAETNLISEAKVLELDAEVLPDDLQLTTYNLITSLEPFGIGNPKPKFLIKAAELKALRLVGASGQHAQFKFKLGEKLISGIGFGLSKSTERFKIGDSLDLAAELIEDSWNGNRQLKLRIVDIKNTNA